MANAFHVSDFEVDAFALTELITNPYQALAERGIPTDGDELVHVILTIDRRARHFKVVATEHILVDTAQEPPRISPGGNLIVEERNPNIQQRAKPKKKIVLV